MKKDIRDIAFISAIVLTALADIISYINYPDLLFGILIVGSLGNFLISYFISLGIIAMSRR